MVHRSHANALLRMIHHQRQTVYTLYFNTSLERERKQKEKQKKRKKIMNGFNVAGWMKKHTHTHTNCGQSEKL